MVRDPLVLVPVRVRERLVGIALVHSVAVVDRVSRPRRDLRRHQHDPARVVAHGNLARPRDQQRVQHRHVALLRGRVRRRDHGGVEGETGRGCGERRARRPLAGGVRDDAGWQGVLRLCRTKRNHRRAQGHNERGGSMAYVHLSKPPPGRRSTGAGITGGSQGSERKVQRPAVHAFERLGLRHVGVVERQLVLVDEAKAVRGGVEIAVLVVHVARSAPPAGSRNGTRCRRARSRCGAVSTLSSISHTRLCSTSNVSEQVADRRRRSGSCGTRGAR